eukprot:comp12582_c0_seq1/m.7593 comp12582_c0_seq1/g.7593  ORF comp12582_c0_seq1/g.7593 comp12582_c0_seq1/m.7593 type:complete len:403 (-) comp12582_c0_seq1:510-1718(-)
MYPDPLKEDFLNLGTMEPSGDTAWLDSMIMLTSAKNENPGNVGHIDSESDVSYMQTSPLNLWSPFAMTDSAKNEYTRSQSSHTPVMECFTPPTSTRSGSPEMSRFEFEFAGTPETAYCSSSLFSVQLPTEAQSSVPKVYEDSNLDEWLADVRAHMQTCMVVEQCGPVVANHLLRANAPGDEVTRARMDSIPAELHDYKQTLQHFIDITINGDLAGIFTRRTPEVQGPMHPEDKAKALHQLRALFFDPKGTFCGWRDRLKLLLSRAGINDDPAFECAQIAHSFRFVPDLQALAYQHPDNPTECYEVVEARLNEMREAGTLRLIKPSSTSPPMSGRGMGPMGKRNIRPVRNSKGMFLPAPPAYLPDNHHRDHLRKPRQQWYEPRVQRSSSDGMAPHDRSILSLS